MYVQIWFICLIVLIQSHTMLYYARFSPSAISRIFIIVWHQWPISLTVLSQTKTNAYCHPEEKFKGRWIVLKRKTKGAAQKEEVTLQNITFKGLNCMECRTWWQETSENHTIKENLRWMQVPVFSIQDFEGGIADNDKNLWHALA